MSSIKGLLVALSLAGASFAFTGSSQAGVASGAVIDPAVASTADQPLVEKVWCNAWGCGPGWRPGWGWRGPGWRPGWGYRPGWGGPGWGGPGYIPVCPPGYHLGPYGHACWPN